MAPGVTALERRCQWLLRVYPAGYRRERGEEMLGTLLEATPPDRRWPTLRDGLALFHGRIAGPFRAESAADDGC